MKKILLFLLISIGFIVTSYADAICRDGWLSASEGPGTCSWHGGVSEWTYDGRFEGYDNFWNENHRHGVNWLPPAKMQNSRNKCIRDLAGQNAWYILQKCYN